MAVASGVFSGWHVGAELTCPRRVSFAGDVTVLGHAQTPVKSSDVVLCETSRPAAMMEGNLVTEAVVPVASAAIVPPPPGFRQFSWPRDDWMVDDVPSVDMVVEEVPGWSPGSAEGLPVDLPLSPIVMDRSDNSVAVHVGSSREEFCTPSEVVEFTPSSGDSSTSAMDAALLADSPMLSANFLLPKAQSLGGGWLGRAHFWMSGLLP